MLPTSCSPLTEFYRNPPSPFPLRGDPRGPRPSLGHHLSTESGSPLPLRRDKAVFCYKCARGLKAPCCLLFDWSLNLRERPGVVVR